jgi:CRP-like cAMP-binding protein
MRQGESGDCMYVIQDGLVEVIKEVDGQEVRLAHLGRNEFFGEMEIFENIGRSATIRVVGFARVLSIDKKNLLSRIHEDPSLAYRMIQVMSSRVRDAGNELVQLKLVPPKTDQHS